MKKKLLAMMLIVAMMTTTVCGCGSNKSDTNSKNAEKESEQENAESTSDIISLTLWGEEETIPMLSSMVDSFKEHYKSEAEFDITISAQADSGTKDALLGDVHNGADVFSFPDDQLSGMVAAGALVPVPNAEEISKANLAESVAAATLNETLYAYPMTADNGFFMYYNKEYFSEEDVKTLDGMLAVAQKAGKKVSMEFNSGWYLYAFFGNTGLEFGINEDGVTNHCNWNATGGAVKGVDIADSLMQIASNPAFVNVADGDFITNLKSGDVIAGINGVWNAVGVKEAWGDNYGAVKLPTYTVAGQQIQMSSFTGYKMMGVNAYSENKEWALKLADWLTNEENQTIRFEERSQGPSNINAAASDAVSKVPAIQAVIEQSKYGNLQRVGNSFWAATTEFADNILAGNPAGTDKQELMDTLVAGITQSAAN